ncbi:MAG: type III-A CRISPR-associated RAMP protein Csm3 [Firmicutes bacterium]|nr:type III-A CRISPR-associated RAMP protein Csm3 [Bacillota bacterium]
MPETEALIPIRGKLLVTAELVLVTGLHIGAQSAGMEIGAVDQPVIRDPLTQYPYIPGSSLKGKLRALVERTLEDLPLNRDGGPNVKRHECSDRSCPSCRVFGSVGGRTEDNIPSRLAVRDLFLTPASREQLAQLETGLRYTEWKFENALHRITLAANPRQIERVPAGSRFIMQWVYTVEDEPERCLEDIERLMAAMRLLEDDALGGHGSRGYGQVRFENFRLLRRPLGYYFGEEPEAARTFPALSEWSRELAEWAITT